MYVTPNQKSKMPSSRAVVWYVCDICMHTIVFELSLSEKERKKKMNKIKFLLVVFSPLIKVSETYTVDLAIE